MATITYALGAVAVALVGVIVAELAFTGSDPEQAVAVAASELILPAPPPPPPKHGDQDAAWALTALGRPLFNPDRRPPATAASTPLPNRLPRLAGTVVSSSGKRAVFATGNKPAVVGEGSSIDAWTVQLISAGTVTLTGPDGLHVLHVSFATGDTAHEVRAVELPLSLRPVRTHSRTDVVAGK